MFFGVLALVGVTAASSIASDTLLAYEEQVNGRAATVTGYVDIPQEDLEFAAPGIAETLNTRLGETGSAVVSTESTMFIRTPEEAENNEPVRSLVVEWDAGDLSVIRRLATTTGSFPLPDRPYPPLLAVNEVAARQLGYPDQTRFMLMTTPEGAGAQFTIVSVIADGASDPKAYGNLSAFGNLFEAAEIEPAAVRVTSTQIAESASSQLIADALVDHQLQLTAPPTRTDTTWRVAAQIDALSFIFTVFAVVMLLIAAMGLLNVGLSSVNERSRELVIRRAIGAHRRDVFMLVMGSSLAIAVVVAIVATGAAIVLVYGIVPSMLPAGSVVNTPSFPWAACLVGCAAATLTAVAGAAVPAIKAARLPVALALRE
ncbi:ABC transporter permease [Microbacterium sp. NPDC058389]|uniref:ABC transporter permease n=1 Tax=Microbacterium sp. NPDC058389 TaxID=3346475 RepID=UPI0036553E57